MKRVLFKFFLLTHLLGFMAPWVYADDIVLTGNQTMILESTTYTQTGNIYIKDNAKLTLNAWERWY
jgi:hypothetical protein